MAAEMHRGDVEDLLREAAPRVLAAVVRRFGDFAGEYERAATLTHSLPERDYLTKRAARLRAAG